MRWNLKKAGFGDTNGSIERTERFEEIRPYFEVAWSDQLKLRTGKTMHYFTEHSAVGNELWFNNASDKAHCYFKDTLPADVEWPEKPNQSRPKGRTSP